MPRIISHFDTLSVIGFSPNYSILRTELIRRHRREIPVPQSDGITFSVSGVRKPRLSALPFEAVEKTPKFPSPFIKREKERMGVNTE
jgi:hypothetical protein